MSRILYRLLVSLARLAVPSRRSKDLGIIVLRQQLTVLHRQTDRPALADEDRILLGTIAAALRRPQRAGWLVTPDTLLRWHRRRTGPTVRSISDHPSPPTLQTSQMGTSKSSRRPAVADSLTSTEMPPDQPRRSFRHAQAGDGMFTAWEDPAFFAGVSIGPLGGITWSESLDLCPDDMHMRLTPRVDT